MWEWLMEAGMFLTFVGGWVLASILIMSKKEAIETGVTRFAGDTDEEDFKLPMVQLFWRQSRRTIAGMTLITIGCLLQMIAAWPRN